MAHNKMLIDATHPEETRVVVLKDGRVEEFDYESAARKLLRGSIYLAKVTRVEPSLQAAFVDYGGNRHGFLAFNEIHPDYYQIPHADRQALIDEEARVRREDEEAEEAQSERRQRRPRQRRRRERGRDRDGAGRSSATTGTTSEADLAAAEGLASLPVDLDIDPEAHAIDVTSLLPPEAGADTAAPTAADIAAAAASRAIARQSMPQRLDDGDVVRSEPVAEAVGESEAPAQVPVAAEQIDDVADAPHPIGLVEDEGVHEVAARDRDDNDNDDEAEDDSDEDGAEAGADGQHATAAGEDEHVESVGAEDVEEEMPQRPRRRLRSYKIQEVIKRRQVVLIQVVKEERGTKGAALTTYLSLAGRYTVLMPNTGRGGGISRKITNGVDRKRLKEIADELEVPEGMGLIIRTAGAARTMQEIKRDFEYLLRLWESVRELTLQSTAPCLVYEEGDLIKRSIRDLYSKDIDEIVVAGEAAHREAHDFMRMLMPSHAKNVINYDHPEPLFTKYRIEQQLNAMFSPYVHLRSGGYLVINQTEALVSVDINSGKSTREFSIEETALNTNLEAADEIARQLRLRDLAGLIVIDFIDMEENRNNRAVERRMKDALRFDRARIQVGRISHFGLLEMSRQRLRTGVLEGSTSQCPHCQGTGIIRSTESVALAVLRGVEDALKAGAPSSLVVSTTAPVAIYLLNNKRQFIIDMESRYGITIVVQASDKLQGANFAVDRSGPAVAPPSRSRPQRSVVNMESGFSDADGDDDGDGDEMEMADADAEGGGGASAGGDGEGEAGEGRSRKRRRRRGRGRGERDGRDGREGGVAATGAADDDEAGERDTRGSNIVEVDDARGDDDDENGETENAEASGETGEERGNRRRRRGRRGGRRNREGHIPAEGVAAPNAPQPYLDVGFDDGADAGERANEAQSPNAPAASDSEANDRPSGRGRGPRRPRDRAPGADVADTGDRSTPADEEPTTEPSARTQDGPPPSSVPVNGAPQPAAAVATAPAAVPAPEPTPATQAEPVAEPPPRSPRVAPIHGEPVIERVVVGDTVADAPASVVSEPQPTRKGWWQRKLGI